MMPSSAVRTFTDPDDYAAAIRATGAEMTVTGRGQFTAKRILIDMHRLWMQRFSENLPRIFHSRRVRSAALAACLAKIEKLEAAMQVLFWRIARRGLAKLAF
jgi:hypothetical protein